MIFQTHDPRIFVGFTGVIRAPIWMAKDKVGKIVNSPSKLPGLSLAWSDDEFRLHQDGRDGWHLVGGWPLYADLLNFAATRIFRKGTELQRFGYAAKLANRMMFGEEYYRPDLDELRGFADAMQHRTDRFADPAYFQRRGVEMLAAMADRPTVILA